MGKIFAISDIHGCLHKLENLMPQLKIDNQQDKIVFLGDYIDRGQYSYEVVEFIIQFKMERDNVICLLGNHEELFRVFLQEGRNKGAFYQNGGLSTLTSYRAPNGWEDIPEGHRLFFSSLLPFYETEEHYFVHAGMRPGIPINEQTKDDLLWIRYEFIDSSYNFGKTVVFGHTPFHSPLITANRIGIDTGAVYGGKLTCVELPRKVLYQS